LKRSLIDWLCCPQCRGVLSLAEGQDGHGEVETGLLHCSGCQTRYPIVHCIPRFVPSDNYAGSFGFQWKRFQRTQLDSHTTTTISRDRFLRQTGWAPQSLSGATVLDVGCGAGRFAEVALSLGAHVVALDYSEAVDACWQNLYAHPNLHVLQADIYALPCRQQRFDYVYCFGVLQHTPDPHKAFMALPAQLKPGGHIAVDVYPCRLRNMLHPKYWLRPLTVRLPRATLFRSIERSVPFLLALSRALGQLPTFGPYLRRLVPVAHYDGAYPLNEQQMHEWAVLDTFDWFAPAYDKPQTAQALRSWLSEAWLEDVQVLDCGHLVGRGRKP
jgi:SAM-dependent methyltransferase/uncharacterized protein YbaR (Trm112 family)